MSNISTRLATLSIDSGGGGDTLPLGSMLTVPPNYTGTPPTGWLFSTSPIAVDPAVYTGLAAVMDEYNVPDVATQYGSAEYPSLGSEVKNTTNFRLIGNAGNTSGSSGNKLIIENKDGSRTQEITAPFTWAKGFCSDFAMSPDEQYLAIGANQVDSDTPYAARCGHVFIYVNSGTGYFTYSHDIPPYYLDNNTRWGGKLEFASGNFLIGHTWGSSTSLGDALVVYAPGNPFTFVSETTTPNPDASTSSTYFGLRFSISPVNNLLVATGYNEATATSNGSRVGCFHSFHVNPTTGALTHLAQHNYPETENLDESFGYYLDISESGNAVVVNCTYRDGRPDDLFLYTVSGTTLTYERALADNGVVEFNIGIGLAMDDRFLFVSYTGADTDLGTNSGAIAVYDLQNAQRPYITSIYPKVPRPNANFASVLSIEGDELLIGSPNMDTNGLTNNGAYDILNITVGTTTTFGVSRCIITSPEQRPFIAKVQNNE